MNKLAVNIHIRFLFVIFVLFIGSPAQAQDQNLLKNPGFEAPFNEFADASPARQVADGWSPWYIGNGASTSENIYPEYYPASNVSDALGVPRIRNGSDAQQYFSFFATHDGGVFQRVTGIPQGAQVEFSAYIYVWSTSFDDVDLSEQDGGVLVQVGIDPTGGTTGDSGNIVWSSPSSLQYDAYNQYTVQADAQGTAVTVFVRTTVSTPVKISTIYVDDASLMIVDGTNQPPPATATTISSPVPTATNTSVPVATSTPTATATQLLPTATSTSGDLGIVTATLAATEMSPLTTTPVSTDTLVPSSTPVITATQVVASETPVPPSATALPTNTPTTPPTFTATPSPTLPPTNTVIPASPTPTQETQSITPTLPPGTPISSEFPGRVFHTVQAGDVVFNLARLYGSTTDAIIAANGLNSSGFINIGQVLVIPVRLSAPATSTPSVTPNVPSQPPTVPTVIGQQPNTIVYIVQPGDTLNRIAPRFNTTVTTIAQLNRIANINLIRVGQQLLIPAAGTAPGNPPPQQTTYVVRPGDTLFRIALRNGVPLYLLAQANGIANPNLVYVGQVLLIP